MCSAHFFIYLNFFQSTLYIFILKIILKIILEYGRFKKFKFSNILHFLEHGTELKKKYLLRLSQIQKPSLMNIMLLSTEQLIHQCLFKSLKSYKMIPMQELGQKIKVSQEKHYKYIHK